MMGGFKLSAFIVAFFWSALVEGSVSLLLTGEEGKV